MSDIESWLRERAITEVECLVSDQSGVARGKILPAAKFIRSLGDDSLRIPEELFVQTVTGDYPHDQENRVTDPAMRLRRRWGQRCGRPGCACLREPKQPAARGAKLRRRSRRGVRTHRLSLTARQERLDTVYRWEELQGTGPEGHVQRPRWLDPGQGGVVWLRVMRRMRRAHCDGT